MDSLPDKKILEKHLGTLNFNFNYKDHTYTFEDLIRENLPRREIVDSHRPCKAYDMTPSAENYSRLMSGEGLHIHTCTPSFNIAVLDHIARYGYPTQRLSSEWNYLCPYTVMFRDLAEKITRCADPLLLAQLQQTASTRAQCILEETFPRRRRDDHGQSLNIYVGEETGGIPKNIHKL